MKRCGFGKRRPSPARRPTARSARESAAASAPSHAIGGGSGAGTKASYPPGYRIVRPCGRRLREDSANARPLFAATKTVRLHIIETTAIRKQGARAAGAGERGVRRRICLAHSRPSTGAYKDWLTSGRSTTPLPSCPDLFRASTSLRRFAHAGLVPRCRKAWMPGTSPLLSGLTLADRVQGVGTAGFPAHRPDPDTDCGAPARRGSPPRAPALFRPEREARSGEIHSRGRFGTEAGRFLRSADPSGRLRSK